MQTLSPSEGDFRSCHELYHTEVLTFIRSRVHDEDDANDLTVEAFVRAYHAWDGYRTKPSMPVLQWLLEISRSVCDAYRRQPTPPKRRHLA
jgi:DNA-directed RNA polymerase specialized sigma24 family protein